MEKLKRKTFIVIFSILTIFLISILCIFNYEDYKHEETEIRNNLNKMVRRSENAEFNNADFNAEKAKSGKQNQEASITENQTDNQTKSEPIFMDTIVYTAIYNDE